MSAGGRGVRLAGLAGLAVAYGALVAHHAFLGDDAFISFRYARNLVEGHGLVFNPGERVEGYTNFLWVLLMAASLWLGIPPEWASNALGIASGAAILALLLRLGARSFGWRDPFVWLAPLCLAGNRSFCAWSTGGLETQLFSLWVLLALLRFADECGREGRGPRLSALWFALAALTRPEGVLFIGVAAAFLAWDSLAARRRRPADLALFSALCLAPVLAHLAWRFAYYGDLLPNTFYAKVSGFWWEQSSAWLGMFLDDHALAWFAPLLLPLWRARRERRTALFAAAAAAYTAYLVAIGGDRFEYRLLVPILPLLFWLAAVALREAAAWARERGAPQPWAEAAALAVGLALVAASARPSLSPPALQRRGVSSIEALGMYARHRAEQGRALRRLVEQGRLRGDERIAVTGAGALPYYAGLPTLDIGGLNDRRVAHQPLARRGVIGHEKYAPYAYLVERGVAMIDVLNRLVVAAPPQARHVEREYYRGPFRCVEADGVYLCFATALPEARFREVFSRFRVVF